MLSMEDVFSCDVCQFCPFKSYFNNPISFAIQFSKLSDSAVLHWLFKVALKV